MKKSTDSNESSVTHGAELPIDNLKQDSDNDTPKTSYTAQNSELDSLLDDATTTVEETKIQAREAKSEKPMSAEDAAGIAVEGLLGVVGLINDNTRHDIVIPEKSLMLFAGLTAPLVMKYGEKINLDPEKIDLDSWMPEVMAVGATVVVGLPMYKQMTEKVVNNDGDKPEPSA